MDSTTLMETDCSKTYYYLLFIIIIAKTFIFLRGYNRRSISEVNSEQELYSHSNGILQKYDDYFMLLLLNVGSA